MDIRKVLLGATKVACGVLGLVLFRWTPTTAKGILFYALLFCVLIAVAIGLSRGRNNGYWPDKPKEQ